MRHQSPFFCPYCGDETIRPYGERNGEWQCESCRRAFALRSVPQAAPAPAGPDRAETVR